MWLRNAFIRLYFPEAVFLKRFFAPDCDFIFGITVSYVVVGGVIFGSIFFFCALSGEKIIAMVLPSSFGS